jgi:hypothetical protein
LHAAARARLLRFSAGVAYSNSTVCVENDLVTTPARMPAALAEASNPRSVASSDGREADAMARVFGRSSSSSCCCCHAQMVPAVAGGGGAQRYRKPFK